MKGYIKPLLKDAKLHSEEDGFLETVWEGFVGFFKFVLKNQRTDTVATKIPLEGDLNQVTAGIFPAVFNIFENAWIKAFKGDIDEDIDYRDAFRTGQGEELTGKEKRQARRAERKEEREKRKEEKENDN